MKRPANRLLGWNFGRNYRPETHRLEVVSPLTLLSAFVAQPFLAVLAARYLSLATGFA